MHVGINALALNGGQNIANAGGLQVYTECLIRELSRIDKKNQYTVFCPESFSLNKVELTDNFRVISCPVDTSHPKRTKLWQHSFFRSFIKRAGIQVLHSPANQPPISVPCRSVVTLHDTISFQPQYLDIPYIYRVIDSGLIAWGVKKADRIITVSQTSKEAIMSHFRLLPERIEVIYHGIPTHVAKKNSVAKPSKRPYLLWVGRTTRFKNLINLLRAYKVLISKDNIAFDLYLVGIPGNSHDKILKEISTLNLSQRVFFLGYQSESDLRAYYENASLFVFPSLVEGFGFPILEAMSYGVPVVTSGRGALKEIAADAAFLVNPESVEDIAGGIRTVLKNDDLKKDLIKKGRVHVQQFSWERCARQTIEVYESACDEGPK